MKTLKNRIEEIKQLKKEECWYVTKQPLSFKDLCFAAKIVEDFIGKNRIGNFEQFFKIEVNKNKYPISANHRMTSNCYYLGLLEKDEKGAYKDAKLTAVYTQLKEK